MKRNTHETLSKLEMCHLSSEQGRTRVFTEATMMYVAGGNPRIYPPQAENAAQEEEGHF